MQKTTVETKLIDLASAFGLFDEQENLLALLREGTLIAVGKYQWVIAGPYDPPVEFSEISAGTWSDYRFIAGNNILTNDDEYQYSAIHLNRDALHQCLTDGKRPDDSVQNKGGRPNLYDWDTILPKLINSAFKDNPDSLDSWVKRSLDMRVWKKGTPDSSTVRRKLKPYYDELFLSPD